MTTEKGRGLLKYYILPALFLLISFPAFAEEQSWFDSWKTDVANTWKSDNYELIVPVHIYHVRASYSREKIKRFNENPQFGLGIGKYYTDEFGNDHMLYAVVFQESYYNPQPTAGYMWQKKWSFGSESRYKVGAGYAAVLTARRKQDYIPFPLATPTFSLSYGNIWLRTAWVPWMGYNLGNVFLTTVSYRF